MQPQVYKMYRKADPPKKLKINYDLTGKRPAWLHVRGLPGGANIIRVRWGKERILYMTYLPSLFPFFLPVDHTHEELRKYYDRCAAVYDKKIAVNNLPAAHFLLSKLKLPGEPKILDLGAGTGFCASLLVNSGYKNITLVDYSAEMLDKAKRKKELADCKFIHSDVRQLKLAREFDMVISLFSFAVDAYFSREEMPPLWKSIAELLKPNGVLALLGHEYEPPSELFKRLDSGYYDITGKEDFTKWYIGRKV